MEYSLTKEQIANLHRVCKSLTPLINKRFTRTLPILGTFLLSNNTIKVFNGVQGTEHPIDVPFNFCVDGKLFTDTLSVLKKDSVFTISEERPDKLKIKSGKTEIVIDLFNQELFIFKDKEKLANEFSFVASEEFIEALQRCIPFVESDNIYSLGGVFLILDPTSNTLSLLGTENNAVVIRVQMDLKETTKQVQLNEQLTVLLPVGFCKQFLTFCKDEEATVSVSLEYIKALFANGTYLFSTVDSTENQKATEINNIFLMLTDTLSWDKVPSDLLVSLENSKILYEKDPPLVLKKISKTDMLFQLQSEQGEFKNNLEYVSETFNNESYTGNLPAIVKIIKNLDFTSDVTFAFLQQNKNVAESFLVFKETASKYIITIMLSSY